MRRKFRGRAAMQKETAADPTPVRFPDSYGQGNHIMRGHEVRVGRLLGSNLGCSYNVDWFDRF
jgi:hypothetical protein